MKQPTKKHAQLKREDKGLLILVLHMHLPYIRHHDRDDYLEERWYYEAMLETYLPLLDMMERLAQERNSYRLTISMTPTLLDLLEDKLMQKRFLSHLDRLIELADLETKRLTDDSDFLPLARRYAEQFRYWKSYYLEMNMNLIPRFASLQKRGHIEILTSAATHAFLPLCKTEEAIRAQLATAIREYERHFGQRPRGLWLPECAFTGGIDRIMKGLGLEYTFVDSTAVQYATPHANRGLKAPLITPYGVTVFPRDPESSLQVWSATEGYPADYNYREYYRDIGWDLGWESEASWEYIRPYVLPTFERVNTGIKYFRITGEGANKEPYEPELAAAKAQDHAEHFVQCRERQAAFANDHTDRIPLMVSPYDAELFGHWWHEGPQWLEAVCRKLHEQSRLIRLTTPSEYMLQFPLSDTGRINESSLGRNASAEVWLQGNNDWIYRHLHQAEERMIRLATRYRDLADDNVIQTLLRRALNQAARELMLAQSSDWAFIMDAKTVVDYAVRRTKQHLNNFRELCDAIEQDQLEPEWITSLEEQHTCFPNICFADFSSSLPLSPVSILTESQWRSVLEQTEGKRNVFMLAWEYPPHNVGGLSRSVHEFAKALADQGEAVHVVTTAHFGSPYFERSDDVYIHRVPVLTSGTTDFWHWMFEMNLAMIDHLVQWKEGGGQIDVLHAHDWMVYYTAREIKRSYRLPLIATFHATEWGRNEGRIEGELQKRIHRLEGLLAEEAQEIVVCSRHMAKEIQQLFHPPETKLNLIPNGIDMVMSVDSDVVSATNCIDKQGPIVFFVGRLVFEKGVHVLLHAAPHVLALIPDARFVIAGSGPMEGELREQATSLGDQVRFLGFIDPSVKAAWAAAADVIVIPSLYEPFGIVALEAIQYRTPLVVSDTGGLAEIVDHGINGFKALPGHVESLAWHLTEMLLHPEKAKEMADHAYRKMRNEYHMPRLAGRLSKLYPTIRSIRRGVHV